MSSLLATIWCTSAPTFTPLWCIASSKSGLQAGFQWTGGDALSTGAQYVTPDSKMYCEKVKMCRFSSGNWFFCTKFMQLAVAGTRRNTAVHLKKECNKLDLTTAQYF
jgi:hypothetical protein